MPITITQGQYDALYNLAKQADEAEADRLQALIDEANGVKRYRLNIRWQNVGGVTPTRIEIGKGWPEDQTYLLELDRPITRDDVDVVLNTQATNPADVHVTPDRYGNVGWTEIDQFDFTSAAQ